MKRLIAPAVAIFGAGATLVTCQLLSGIDELAFTGTSSPDAGTGGDAGGDSGPSGGAGGAVGGAGGQGGTLSCPGGQGPTMVALPDGFCIDSTEVTVADYVVFTESGAGSTLATPECQGAVVEPTTYLKWPPADPALWGQPVVGIGWCAAAAYCAWANKSLCGTLGKIHGSFGAPDDYAESQWYAACAGDAGLEYPYGNGYDAGACNGADLDAGLLDAGALATCRGPTTAVFDLSGNVGEWEDACNAYVGLGDDCLVRGGSFTTTDAHHLMCAGHRAAKRGKDDDATVGFRCCSP